MSDYSPEPGHVHHWQLLTHIADGDSHDWYFTCGCCCVLHRYEYTPADKRARVTHENVAEPMSWDAAWAHGLSKGMRYAVGMSMVGFANALRAMLAQLEDDAECDTCGWSDADYHSMHCFPRRQPARTTIEPMLDIGGPEAYGHANPPPGYEACTRPWPHDGPCAHRVKAEYRMLCPRCGHDHDGSC